MPPACAQKKSYVLWGLVLLGGWIRFFHLGKQSFWFDEILTLRDASFPVVKIPKQVLASPPLYQMLMHGMEKAGFHTEAALRLPSALFGIAALPIFFYITERWIDRRAALWGTALLALSPFHCLFSQEVRMYSLLFLLAMLSLWRWNEMFESAGLRPCAEYVLWTTIGLYVHNWFLFLWVSQSVAGVVVSSSNVLQRRRMFSSVVIIAALWSPWIPFVWHQAHQALFGFLPRPGARQVWDTLKALAGLCVPCGAGSLSLPWKQIPWAHACALILFCIGLWNGRRSRWMQRIFWAGGFGPLALAFTVSRWGPASFYHPGRYTLMALPAYLWTVSYAFSGQKGWVSRCLAPVLAIAWMAFCGESLHTYFTVTQKAPWKQMAVQLKTDPRRLSTFLHTATAVDRMSLEYYWGAPLPAPHPQKNAVLRDVPRRQARQATNIEGPIQR